MSIKRMEGQLARLNAKVVARESELVGLKNQRKELKARLAEAKKALKDGRAVPVFAEPEGLAERISSAITENVIDPLTEFLTPPPEAATLKGPSAGPRP
jgi:hypothetical protein